MTKLDNLVIFYNKSSKLCILGIVLTLQSSLVFYNLLRAEYLLDHSVHYTDRVPIRITGYISCLVIFYHFDLYINYCKIQKTCHW